VPWVGKWDPESVRWEGRGGPWQRALRVGQAGGLLAVLCALGRQVGSESVRWAGRWTSDSVLCALDLRSSPAFCVPPCPPKIVYSWKVASLPGSYSLCTLTTSWVASLELGRAWAHSRSSTGSPPWLWPRNFTSYARAGSACAGCANAVSARPACGLWFTQTTCAICTCARANAVRTCQCCACQTCIWSLVNANHMRNLRVGTRAHVPMLWAPDLHAGSGSCRPHAQFARVHVCTRANAVRARPALAKPVVARLGVLDLV